MQSMKGQAAVEYLMNYSWAILVLALVMGAMLFSGVFSPSYFVMEECYIGPSFACTDQLVTQATGTKLLFNLTNRLGYEVRIANVSFYTEDLGKNGNGETSVVFTNGTLLNGDSNVSSTIFSGPAQPAKGTVEKILVNVSYYVCAEEVNPTCSPIPPFLRTVSGRIVTKVI
jgi:hypothetical protein